MADSPTFGFLKLLSIFKTTPDSFRTLGARIIPFDSFFVGIAGVEPAASCSQSKRLTPRLYPELKVFLVWLFFDLMSYF